MGTSLRTLADAPMPMTTLGKSGLQISRFTLGGHHMRVRGEEGGVKIIHRAMDLGVTMFDSAHKYHNGESDKTYGIALQGGRRQKIVLMSKAQLRTRDGAKTWNFVSFVTPEPKGQDHAIMPSSVRLSDQAIVTTVRYRNWIDVYRSDDDGQTWKYVSRAANEIDNPPSLVHLRDGRLALTYGRRITPFGIRARLSTDEGKTWSEETILRNDGGCWDLGYTRTVQRPDGKLVTVYYFNDSPEHERQIAATIWEAK